MIITHSADSIKQARPTKCACKKSRFQRHSSYWRKIAREWTFRFICRLCKTFVTIIPSSFVPYKHHPVSTIESALDSMVRQGRSGAVIEREVGVHRITIHHWVKEFAGHCSVLATEGARRLGMAPLSGSFKRVYRTFKQHYMGGQFFCRFQADLCRDFPPLGIFRPLIMQAVFPSSSCPDFAPAGAPSKFAISIRDEAVIQYSHR